MSITKPTINKLLSLLLVLSVVLAGLLPSTAVYASESGTSTVVLNTSGLNFEATVPYAVFIHVDEQGEVTITPDDLQVINHTAAPIKIQSLTVTTKNDWTLDPIYTNYKGFKFNRKHFWLGINGQDPSNGPLSFATPIQGYGSFDLVLSADVPPQLSVIDGLNICEIAIILDWDSAEQDNQGDQGIGNYVLATDEDWEGEADGEFHYIGSNPYVIIPHVIKGIPVTSYEGMFKDTHVKGVYSDNPNIITTKAMFRGTAIEEVLLETSNVTDMSQMFAKVEVDELDLTKLNTSKVKNFQHMFWDAKVPKLDLSNFDTSSAETLSFMFMQTVTNELDLSSFDIPETADTNSMFGLTPVTKGYAKTQEDADRLNSSIGKPEYLTFIVRGGGDGSDSDYDDPDFNPDDYPEGYVMSKNSDWMISTAWAPHYIGNDDYVIIPRTIKGYELTGLQGAFSGTHPVKGVYVDNSNITNARDMFKGNTSTSLDLQYINIPNAAYMSSMFENTKANTLDLTGWDVSNVTHADRMFKNAEATEIVLSGLNFSALNQANEMFAYTKADTIKIKSIGTDPFGNPEVVFKSTERMFENAEASVIDLSEFPLHIWREGDVHSFDFLYADMFKGVSPTATVYAYDRDNAAMIKEMKGTPTGLNPVIKGQPVLPEGYVLAVDSDFSGTSDGSFRFTYKYNGYNGQYKLHEKFVLPSVIKGEAVTSYQGMMSDFQAGDENKLPTHFKSSNPAITDMSYMFQRYPTATLNLDFNTSNVTTMAGMFSGTKATNLDLSGFNVDKVETMSSMFNGAEATTIDISSFKLADTQPDVNWMFKDCTATTVYVRSQADIDYLVENAGDTPATINFVIK